MPLLPSHTAIHSSHPPLFLHSNPLRSRSIILQTLRKKKLQLSFRLPDYFEPQKVAHRSLPERSSFAAQSHGTQPTRVYAEYSIYKGKAVLSIDPRSPKFAPLNSGAFKVSKEGYILLQFAPAVGTRQYDWSRKQVFSLSVGEIGTLMGLGAKDACEFFHDPFKGRRRQSQESSKSGTSSGWQRPLLQSQKTLSPREERDKKTAGRDDRLGRPAGTTVLDCHVQNRVLNVDESIYIPITRAELIIMNSAFSFILPYLLGWHAFADNIKPEDSTRSNFTSYRSEP